MNREVLKLEDRYAKGLKNLEKIHPEASKTLMNNLKILHRILAVLLLNFHMGMSTNVLALILNHAKLLPLPPSLHWVTLNQNSKTI